MAILNSLYISLLGVNIEIYNREIIYTLNRILRLYNALYAIKVMTYFGECSILHCRDLRTQYRQYKFKCLYLNVKASKCNAVKIITWKIYE